MKQHKARCKQILVQIHRGFLSPEESAKVTDEEVFKNIPPNSLSPKRLANGSEILVSSPFTYKWVMKRLKKNPKATAYDMLVEAGFMEASGDS